MLFFLILTSIAACGFSTNGNDLEEQEDRFRAARQQMVEKQLRQRDVRDERVLSLEDAVRKMTSAVADRLGLRERGLLRVGCYADVVVFDPATIADQATFEAPHQLATGVRDVWVNGQRVLLSGQHTGATPGRFVARQARA